MVLTATQYEIKTLSNKQRHRPTDLKGSPEMTPSYSEKKEQK